jgi:hypothetical protein
MILRSMQRLPKMPALWLPIKIHRPELIARRVRGSVSMCRSVVAGTDGDAVYAVRGFDLDAVE